MFSCNTLGTVALKFAFEIFCFLGPRVSSFYHPESKSEHSREVKICFSWLLNFQGLPRGGCRHDTVDWLKKLR